MINDEESDVVIKDVDDVMDSTSQSARSQVRPSSRIIPFTAVLLVLAPGLIVLFYSQLPQSPTCTPPLTWEW